MTRHEASSSDEERLNFFAGLVADHCHDAIVVTGVDGCVEWVNAAFARSTAYSLDDVQGRKPGHLLQERETDADTVHQIGEALANHVPIRTEILNDTKADVPYWVEIHIAPVFSDAGTHTHFIAVERDVLERTVHWGDITLPRHVAAESCWALRRGRAYFYGSQAIQLPCSHSEPEGPEGKTPFLCLPIIAHGETIGLMHLVCGALAMPSSSIPVTDGEFLSQRWATAQTCAEQISLAIANVQLRHELEDRSVRDQLTGPWNRRRFLQVGAQEVRNGEEAGQPFSLVVLDIDFFKRIADIYGHDGGDLVLRDVAAGLLRHANEGALPCRLGGEEFVVVLPGADTGKALVIAEDIRAEIAAVEVRLGETILPSVTASAGVATFPAHGTTIGSLLRVADLALYAAKESGRDRTVSADSPSTRKAAETAGTPPLAELRLGEAGTAALDGETKERLASSIEMPSVPPAPPRQNPDETLRAGGSAS
ncbi:MAG: diguanylate cyclase [Pseudomonadota bacterium]